MTYVFMIMWFQCWEQRILLALSFHRLPRVLDIDISIDFFFYHTLSALFGSLYCGHNLSDLFSWMKEPEHVIPG